MTCDLLNGEELVDIACHCVLLQGILILGES
jgi:hypothetical protein